MSGLRALLLVVILVNVCTALQPVNILREYPEEATTITEEYQETFTTEASYKVETTTSEGEYETTTHSEAAPESSTAKIETTTAKYETTTHGEAAPDSSTAKIETTTATQPETSSTTEENGSSTAKVETTTAAKETQPQTSSTPKQSTTDENESSTGKVETTTVAKETTTKHETETQPETSSTTEENGSSTAKVETTTVAKETTTTHETEKQPETSSTTEENESSTGKVETTTKHETATEATTTVPTVPTAPSCTKPGVQPHAEDCHKYNICSLKGSLDEQLHLITKSCPKKQAFNVDYNRCSRDISSCSLDVQCPKKGSVDDPLSNTSYYLCEPRLDGSGYRVFHINCASHEIYYPKFGKCFKDPNSLNTVDWNLIRDIDIVKAEIKLLKKEDKLKMLKLKQEMAEKKKLEKEALKKAQREEKMNKTKAKLEAAKFVCLDEGNFPSAVTESYYIACLNKKGKLKAVSMKCDDGVNFDPDTSACTPTTDDDDSKSADYSADED